MAAVATWRSASATNQGGITGPYTFSGLSVGTATTDRRLAIGFVGNFGAAPTLVVKAKASGQSDITLTQVVSSGTTTWSSRVYEASIPDANTATAFDIEISDTANNFNLYFLAVELYTIVGASGAPTDSGSFAHAFSSASVTKTVPSNGQLIAVALGRWSTVALGGTNVTQDDKTQQGTSGDYILSGHSTATGSITPTISGDAGNGSSMAVAVYSPAATGVTGTSAITEAADTPAGSGTVAVSGTAAPTGAADTPAASGTVAVSGSGAPTEAADTPAGSGTVAVSGSSAITGAADTIAASGSSTGAGSASLTEPADTIAGSGTAPIAGTAAPTEAADTPAGSGTVRASGSASPTEAADTIAGTGSTRAPALYRTMSSDKKWSDTTNWTTDSAAAVTGGTAVAAGVYPLAGDVAVLDHATYVDVDVDGILLINAGSNRFNLTWGHDFTNSVHVHRISSNPHYVNFFTSAFYGSTNPATSNIDRIHFFYDGTSGDGDFVIVGAEGQPSAGTSPTDNVINVTRCIGLPNNAGEHSGYFSTILSATYTNKFQFRIKNNTGIMGSEGFATVEEGSGNFADEIGVFENNLCVEPAGTTPRGYLLRSFDGSGNVANTIRAANVKNNARYLALAGSNGNGYHHLVDGSSGTYGSTDIDLGATGPQFVDATRTPKTFSTSLGGDGSIDDLATKIANGTTTVAALMAYIEAGWTPTNAALQGTGTGGADIGAVAVQASASGTGAITEASDTPAASGTVAVHGSGGPTEASDTPAGSGAVAISGSGAATEGADLSEALIRGWGTAFSDYLDNLIDGAAWNYTNADGSIASEQDATNPDLTEHQFYYDRSEALFKLYRLLGTTSYATRAIDMLRGTGDNYTTYASGVSPPYGVPVYVQFHEGLKLDYLRNGSTASRDLVGRMADYLTADYYRLPFADTTSDHMDGRTIAYALRAFRVAHEISAPSVGTPPGTAVGVPTGAWNDIHGGHVWIDWLLEYVDDLIANNLGTGSWPFPAQQNSNKPFMNGLLGYEIARLCDGPLAADATRRPQLVTIVKKIADYLWANCWVVGPETAHFNPLATVDHGFVYQEVQDPSDPDSGPYCAPDLNLMIVPIWAWLAKEGQTKSGGGSYLTDGDVIFAAGVRQAAYHKSKQYNEAALGLRYLEYRALALGSGDTVASSGTVTNPGVTGSSSLTEPADTPAGTGTVAVSGSAADTEAGDTPAGTGAVPISGSAAITGAADTIAASGTVADPGATGSSAITESADTIAGTGAVAVSGTGAGTEAGDTPAGTGTAPVSGSAAVTDAADTPAGTGAVAVSASGAATEASDTISASGTVNADATGAGAITDPADTPAGTGAVTASGTGSPSEASDTPGGTGAVAVSGSGAITEASDTFAPASVEPLPGGAGFGLDAWNEARLAKRNRKRKRDEAARAAEIVKPADPPRRLTGQPSAPAARSQQPKPPETRPQAAPPPRTPRQAEPRPSSAPVAPTPAPSLADLHTSMAALHADVRVVMAAMQAEMAKLRKERDVAVANAQALEAIILYRSR
jgi:hypothetical protein